MSALNKEAACEIGIQRIGDKFGKTLLAFRFPPGIASALEEICRPSPQPQDLQGTENE